MFVILAVAIFVVCCLFIEKVIRSIKVDGFDQKYVFITGCDSGFGQKLAIRLDSLGFPVFAACLTDDGQKFLSENASTRLTTLSLDVTKTESILKAFDFVKQKLPSGTGLWAIVNNAGVIGLISPSELCPVEEFQKAFAVNVYGPIEMCRKFLPLIRKGKGRVVNIASVLGRVAWCSTIYATSKFAVEGFTDSIRRETQDQGITVSLIEPGIFLKTSLVSKETVLKGVNHFFNLADEEVKTAYKGNYYIIANGLDFAGILSSDDPNLVVDAYTHAIVSRFPKTRYIVGLDARLFFIPASYVPAWITDGILFLVYKIMFE